MTLVDRTNEPEVTRAARLVREVLEAAGFKITELHVRDYSPALIEVKLNANFYFNYFMRKSTLARDDTAARRAIRGAYKMRGVL